MANYNQCFYWFKNAYGVLWALQASFPEQLVYEGTVAKLSCPRGDIYLIKCGDGVHLLATFQCDLPKTAWGFEKI